VAGLGYLPVTTRLTGDKRVVDVTGISLRDGQPFAGYEIHIGQTHAIGPVSPLLRLDSGEEDGFISADGKVAGCYIHRLFDHPAQRGAWLARLGAQSDGIAQDHRVDQALDALAASLEDYIDIDRLLSIAGLEQ
jgi:adenosylcobyric acid synthase